MIWPSATRRMTSRHACAAIRGDGRAGSDLRMTVQRVNLLFRLSAIAMLAGGAVALAVALLVPIRTESADASPATQPSNIKSIAAVPPLDQFEPVFRASLRGRDLSSASATRAAATINSAPGLILIGTVGDRIALLQNGNGEAEVRAVGERITDGDELIAVRPGEADLRRKAAGAVNDEIVTIRKPAESAEPD